MRVGIGVCIRRLPTVILLLALCAAPALAVSVSPAALTQGGYRVLTISTPGWSWSPGVVVSLGEGVTVTGVEVVQSDLLLAQVLTAPAAPEGPRNLVIQQNGAVVVGTGIVQVLRQEPGDPTGGGSAILELNILRDPGFEDRDMSSWSSGTWTIDMNDPHGGEVSAHDGGGTGGGGLCLRQDFDPPIDSNLLTGFSFWLRQPDDQGIAQVAIFYSNGPTRYGAAFTNDADTWTHEDFTSLLRPNDFVTGIHVCGFAGGTPTFDDSWADDFEMTTSEGVPVQNVTWGRIKGLYQER